MLSEEDFKNKYLQHPITFLTEENLDKLETHCRKASKIERGIEYKVVLELLDRYYQYQKEIQDKNKKITKLQKENEELKKYDYRNIKIDEKNKIESPSFTKEQLSLMNLGIALYIGIPKLLEDEEETDI